jgi:integrase/recombinase XerD
MNLFALASHYVAHKQAMGMRFHTEARTLRSFCRTIGVLVRTGWTGVLG